MFIFFKFFKNFIVLSSITRLFFINWNFVIEKHMIASFFYCFHLNIIKIWFEFKICMSVFHLPIQMPILDAILKTFICIVLKACSTIFIVQLSDYFRIVKIIIIKILYQEISKFPTKAYRSFVTVVSANLSPNPYRPIFWPNLKIKILKNYSTEI